MNGFKVSLFDTFYKINFFGLPYYSEYGEIWLIIIRGNDVKLNVAPILKKLRKGVWLELDNFNIQKNGKSFTIPKFTVFIID